MTEQDLNYVLAYARLRGRAPSMPEEVAELVATVRRETIEECARVLDAAKAEWGKEQPPRSYETAWSMTVTYYLSERIRALLDEPKAEVCPPLCVTCLTGDREPEEPGHG